MKKIFVLILFLSVFKSVFSQQDAMYTQYMFNTLAINPAYAGSRNVLSATGIIRNQWAGIEGAPKTQTFTIDAPIEAKKIGLGLQLYSDKLGKTSAKGLVGSYAYRIRMDKASLSFGLQASISKFNTDYGSVKLDPIDLSNDPAFMGKDIKSLANFGAGAYYNSDRFYIGISVPELINNVLPGSQTSINRQRMHVFFMSGYVFSLNNSFKLKPSVLIKEVRGAPLQADLSATVWMMDVMSLGVQYRTNADISGLVEVQVTPQIRFGYSYDHSTTELSGFNSGSHEIMLRYEFGFNKAKILSPRYF